MKINFPMDRVFRGLLLAGILLAGCSRSADTSQVAGDPAPAGAKPLLKVGFQLDWFPAAEHGGHYQALVKNYYRDAGLDVTIVPGGPGQSGMQKVALGQIEFAMGRSDDVILAVSHNLPLLIVGAQMQHDPQAILVHEASPVKSFRDLDGKSMMASPGSNPRRVRIASIRSDPKMRIRSSCSDRKNLDAPGSPWRPERPRSWLSIRRLSCRSVPMT